MKIIVGPKDLRGPVKQLAGFGGLTLGVRGCTPAWYRLERVGKIIARDRGIIPKNEDAITLCTYTGSFELLVRQGGIKLDKKNGLVKSIFRDDVYPSIKELVQNCSNIFKMVLHHKDGKLMMLELHDLINK